MSLLLAALRLLAIQPALAQTANGITENENRRLHQALQPFVVPTDLPHVEALLRRAGRQQHRDRDGDGLTNEVRSGSGPIQNPDTDGDGLLDGWEVYGVNGIDLRASAPPRCTRNLRGDGLYAPAAPPRSAPNNAVLKRIELIYANRPVANPEGATASTSISSSATRCLTTRTSTRPKKNSVKLKRRISTQRAPVYQYMIWANRYEGDLSSGYSFEVPGSDFIVTLGRWHDGDGGTDCEKVGTFAHELGHNLGLRHGGSEEINYKPNHLSIMNYFFQIDGVIRDGKRVYDYQRFALPALNEISFAKVRASAGAPISAATPRPTG